MTGVLVVLAVTLAAMTPLWVRERRARIRAEAAVRRPSGRYMSATTRLTRRDGRAIRRHFKQADPRPIVLPRCSRATCPVVCEVTPCRMGYPRGDLDPDPSTNGAVRRGERCHAEIG